MRVYVFAFLQALVLTSLSIFFVHVSLIFVRVCFFMPLVYLPVSSPANNTFRSLLARPLLSLRSRPPQKQNKTKSTESLKATVIIYAPAIWQRCPANANTHRKNFCPGPKNFFCVFVYVKPKGRYTRCRYPGARWR